MRFDGANYQAPQGAAFWLFDDDRVNIIFEHCHFTNNEVMCHITSGVNARFTNYTFDDNRITAAGSGLALNDAMFYVDESAVVLFKECTHIDELAPIGVGHMLSEAAWIAS